MNAKALGIVLSILVFPITIVCQTSITCISTASYFQNFDAILGPTDKALVNNDPTNLGWYATNSTSLLSTNAFVANDGSAIPAGFRNLGTVGMGDRALGSALGLPATGTNNFLGLRIQNDCNIAATGIQIQYTGEQWSDASGAPQTLAFSYQVAPGDITSLTAGTFINFPGLDFASPNNTNANTALDGNAAGNRVVVNQTINVSIPNSGEIMLRWADTNDPGGLEDSLGIDDVTVTLLIPTAAEISIDGRVVTSDGQGISRVAVTLIGNGEPMHVVTNTFGYYRFTGLQPGNTYLISVSAKKYQFDQPSQVVSPLDNVADIDFVAIPY